MIRLNLLQQLFYPATANDRLQGYCQFSHLSGDYDNVTLIRPVGVYSKETYNSVIQNFAFAVGMSEEVAKQFAKKPADFGNWLYNNLNEEEANEVDLDLARLIEPASVKINTEHFFNVAKLFGVIDDNIYCSFHFFPCYKAVQEGGRPMLIAEKYKVEPYIPSIRTAAIRILPLPK